MSVTLLGVEIEMQESMVRRHELVSTDDESEDRVSLHPLTVEETLDALLKTPPEQMDEEPAEESEEVLS